jgi:hypothetical protein
MTNTTPTHESKILFKLEKLLALSDSPNQHEAEAAMEKAIQLATLHNIDLSRVSIQDRSVEQIINEAMSADAKRLSMTHVFVVDILRTFFSVRILTGGSRHFGKKIYFIGRKTDIDNAKFLYSFLNSTFMRLWHNYYKVNPHLQLSITRKSYFNGLWQGLSAKLKAAKVAVEQSLRTDENAGYQIMLVDHEKALQDAVTNFHPNVKYVKGKVTYCDPQTLNAGYKDGGNIQIHSGLTHTEKSQITA